MIIWEIKRTPCCHYICCALHPVPNPSCSGNQEDAASQIVGCLTLWLILPAACACGTFFPKLQNNNYFIFLIMCPLSREERSLDGFHNDGDSHHHSGPAMALTGAWEACTSLILISVFLGLQFLKIALINSVSFAERLSQRSQITWACKILWICNKNPGKLWSNFRLPGYT